MPSSQPQLPAASEPAVPEPAVPAAAEAVMDARVPNHVPADWTPRVVGRVRKPAVRRRGGGGLRGAAQGNACKGWCYTTFPPDEEQTLEAASLYMRGVYDTLEECERLQYAVMQLEMTPETNRYHVQGYMEFKVSPIGKREVRREKGKENLREKERPGTRDPPFSFQAFCSE